MKESVDLKIENKKMIAELEKKLLPIVEAAHRGDEKAIKKWDEIKKTINMFEQTNKDKDRN